MLDNTTNWAEIYKTVEEFDHEQRHNSAPPALEVKRYVHPRLTEEQLKNLRPYLFHDWADLEELFVRQYGHKYRYSPERGMWLVFHTEDNEQLNIKKSHAWEWDHVGFFAEDLKKFLRDIKFTFTPPPFTEETAKTPAQKAELAAWKAFTKAIEESPYFPVTKKEVTKKVPKEGGKRGEKEEVTVEVEEHEVEKAEARARAHSNKLVSSWGAQRHFENYLKTNSFLRVGLASFDSNPEELNTPCGLYDLRTLEVTPVGPQNTVKRSTAYAPDFDAATPLYEDLLSKAFDGEREMMDYFDNCMGATLLGGQYLQQFFMLEGAAGSGKGTLMLLATELLGNAEKEGYAASIDSSMLTGAADHPTQNMQFLNARMVFADELPEGSAFNATVMKKLTGGAPITGRYMRMDHVTFEATHNLWVTTNFKVAVDHGDDGMWRRMRVLNTPKGIPAGKRVSQLDKVIASEEGGAVLARWMRAAYNYLNDGFMTPQKALDDLAEYKAEQNTVEQWIGQMCTVYRDEDGAPDKGSHVTRSGARKSYNSWCKAEKLKPVSAQAFGEAIEKALGKDSPGRLSGGASGGNRTRVYYGIKVDGLHEFDL